MDLVASALEDNARNATKEDHMVICTNRIDAADLQRLITYAALHIRDGHVVTPHLGR